MQKLTGQVGGGKVGGDRETAQRGSALTTAERESGSVILSKGSLHTAIVKKLTASP